MNKSIYSLVLSDEVVEAIDRMAYSMNKSRSNLINQILAESVSYVTPEKRIHDVFSRMEEIFGTGGAFKMLMGPSDSIFSIGSALSYKYNPTIKYSLELNRSIDKEIGLLKINLRTQNRTLILYMIEFFKFWASLEEKYLGESKTGITSGKFSKILVRNGDEPFDEKAIAEEISDYIRLLDSSLKAFIANLEYKTEALGKIEKDYVQYLKTHKIVV